MVNNMPHFNLRGVGLSLVPQWKQIILQQKSFRLAFLNVVGFSVSYRDSTIASVVFVLWRVYDIVLFRRFRIKE
jgi:hypothetical protein